MPIHMAKDNKERLNLLYLTEALRAYILESFPDEANMLEFCTYVIFHGGKPYFYTYDYIENVTLSKFQQAFYEMIHAIKEANDDKETGNP